MQKLLTKLRTECDSNQSLSQLKSEADTNLATLRHEMACTRLFLQQLNRLMISKQKRAYFDTWKMRVELSAKHITETVLLTDTRRHLLSISAMHNTLDRLAHGRADYRRKCVIFSAWRLIVSRIKIDRLTNFPALTALLESAIKK